MGMRKGRPQKRGKQKIKKNNGEESRSSPTGSLSRELKKMGVIEIEISGVVEGTPFHEILR